MNEKVFFFALALWLFAFPCALCARKEKGTHFVTAAPQSRTIGEKCNVVLYYEDATQNKVYQSELVVTYDDRSTLHQLLFQSDVFHGDIVEPRSKARQICADRLEQDGFR